MPLVILAARALVCSAVADDGDKQWGPYSVQGFIVGSPGISADGSTIYIGAERTGGGRILAIPSNGGLPKWERLIASGPVDATPAIGTDGTVYIGAGNGHFYALDPNTGINKWELSLAPLNFIDSSAAIAADGTIYFGSGDSIALTGALHAVSPAGTRLWSFPPAGATFTIGIIESSPAIGPDGTVYVGSDDRNLYALTPAGTEKWRFPTGGRILSSPAIGADGTIYFGSGDQKFYALTPQGTKKWEPFVTRGDIQSSPVLGADGTIYFGGVDTTFYALNPDDGMERWTVPLPATMAAPAAVRGDGAIIVPADDNTVRAFDPSGRKLWERSLGPAEYIDGAPLVARDGSIYVGSEDGNLYKLNGSGSPLSVVSSWPGFRHDVANTGRAGPSRVGGFLADIATRARVPGVAGASTLIAGFFVQGLPDDGKPYLVRAVGPGLSAIGVGGFLPDPQLELFSGGASYQTNDNWLPNDTRSGGGSGFSLADTAAGVGAFPLVSGSRDAAIVPVLPPGSYTAHVTSEDGRAGVALVEVYDARPDLRARISNLSTRGPVGTGEDILIAGFVVGGSAPMRLLLRGIGPGLAQFGINGVLARPRLELFRGSTPLRPANTGWKTEGLRNDLIVAAASVSAFSLAEDSVDAAMIFEAAPGPYTLQISGVGETTGIAMVEIYVLP